MKTIACPETALDQASGSTPAAGQAVTGTGISRQTNHPALRMANKCLGKKCIRWQQNCCGALKNMVDAMQEKEQVNHPLTS